MHLACPRCAAALVDRACPAGHGAFAPGEEAIRKLPVALVARIEEGLERGPLGGAACPECRSAMRVFDARGVTLDACPECGGVSFDADERATVLARVKPPAASGPRLPSRQGVRQFVGGVVAVDAGMGILEILAALFG